MISHSLKCIFIHIPKTAGTSVEQKLGLFDSSDWGMQDHRALWEIQPVTWSVAFRCLVQPNQPTLSRRAILRRLLRLPGAKRQMTPKQYRCYYKFAIVRNPWARVYSWYKNVMRDPRHGIGECEFEYFVRHHLDNWALRSQLWWIQNLSGRIGVDRVIRFEKIAAEMGEVLQRLGFSDLTLPHALESKDEGKSSKRSWRENYTVTTARIIAERYKEEIELFGYRFD
jgi:hypothetical protein